LYSNIITWVDHSTSVNIYDTITKKQESFNVNNTIPNGTDGTIIAGKLYVMGGWNPCVKTTYEIDVSKKQMVQKQDMIKAKCYHSLCTLLYQIFSLGGFDGQCLADCEVYDTISNTWKAIPNLATPRCVCAAVVFGRQWIYAIAGYNSSGDINSVERLPLPGNGNWSNVNISSMFSARRMLHGI